MKKVLLISYLFPPVARSGVQRNLKYAKYFPKFSINCIVLSVKNIFYYAYDFSLAKELPNDQIIIRTESLDPFRVLFLAKNYLERFKKLFRYQKSNKNGPDLDEGSRLLNPLKMLRRYLIFPDIQVGWIPFAVFTGVLTIYKYKIDAIVASVEPFSSAVIAFLLHKITGKKYILDFRDGWFDNPHLDKPTSVHTFLHYHLERICVQNAFAVCVYGHPLDKLLTQRYNIQTIILPNGYDPEDILRAESITPKKLKKRFVYMGSLYKSEIGYSNFENINVFFSALTFLPKEIRAASEFYFVGKVFEGFEDLIMINGLSDCVYSTGYLNHIEALSYLKGADAGIILLPEHNLTSVTGKVFEYLACEIPILLCAEPKGSCAEILIDLNLGAWIVPPSDSVKIVAAIRDIFVQDFPKPTTKRYEKYSRVENTRILSNLVKGMKSL